MLRGPQTLGELKQRTERLHAFPDLRSVEEALDRLTRSASSGGGSSAGPGRRRRATRTCWRTTAPEVDEAEGAVEEVDRAHDPRPAPQPEEDALAGEVALLREEVRELRNDVAALRAELGA